MFIVNESMPKSCSDCPCFFSGDDYRGIDCKIGFGGIMWEDMDSKRPSWCPLVELQHDLNGYSTKELVDELIEREGVAATIVKPYEDYTMSTNGPAIVIEVID